MATDLLTKIRGEVQQRLDELRPLMFEHEQLLAVERSLNDMDSAPAEPVRTTKSVARRSRSSASSSTGPAKRSAGKPRAKQKRAAVDPVGLAILDALEHGSHTVSELVTVSAVSAGEIRSSIRRLLAAERIQKVDREGKTAYARQADSPSSPKGD